MERPAATATPWMSPATSNRSVYGTRRAFTLVEMIAITAILLLIAAIATPNYVAIRRGQNERALTASLERLPAEARVEAKRTGVPIALMCDSESFWIESRPSDSDPVEIRRLPLGTDTTVDSLRQGGLDVDTASFEWIVQPDGTANSAEFTLRFGDRPRTLRLGRVGDVRWMDNGGDEVIEESWTAGERVNRGN